MSKNEQKRLIGEIRDRLEEEHRHVLGIVDRLAQPRPKQEVIELLEDLHDTLVKHFAHEEYPDGLYQAMGAVTDGHREELRVLVDDHFVIVSNVRGLLEQAHCSDDESPEALHHAAREIARRLLDHENRELDLAARLSSR